MCSLRFVTGTILTFFIIYIAPSAQQNNTALPKQFLDTAQTSWTWHTVAKFAEHILRIFYSPSRDIVKDVMASGKDIGTRFTQIAIVSVTKHEIGMTFAAGCGIVIAAILLFSPCFILLYRKNQKSVTAEEANENPNVDFFKVNECVVYVFLVIFLCLSTFGGVLMTVGTLRSRNSIPLGFSTAKHFIDATYFYKINYPKEFNRGLRRTLTSSNLEMEKMYDINFRVADIFMKKTLLYLDQMLYSAREADFEINSALEEILYETEALNITLKDTVDDVRNVYRVFREAVDNVSATVNAAESTSNQYKEKLKKLTDVPMLIVDTTNSSQIFEKLTINLTLAANMSILQQVYQIGQKLSAVRDDFKFSPKPAIAILQQAIFKMMKSLKEKSRVYFKNLNATFPLADFELLSHSIKNSEESTTNYYSYIYPVFVAFGILGSIFSISMFIFFTLAILANQGRKRVSVSHDSYTKLYFFDFTGKLLLFICYVTSCFLWLFWLISVYLFVASAVPYELCLTTEDMSVINIAMRNQTFENVEGLSHPPWYTIFQSKKHNTTIKQTIENCEKYKFYHQQFNLVSIVNSTFDEVPDKISSITITVPNSLANLPVANVSTVKYALNLLSGITKNITIGPLFSNISNFMNGIQSINALKVLDEIRNSAIKTGNDKLKTQAKTASSSYKNLIHTLSKAVEGQDLLDFRLNKARAASANAAEALQNMTESFYIMNIFMKYNTTDLYLSTVKETLFKYVNGLKSNVNSSLQELIRKSSFCTILMSMQAKTVHFACNHLSNSVLVSWLGSFLLAFFILFAIILCVITIPTFPLTLPTTSRAPKDSTAFPAGRSPGTPLPVQHRSSPLMVNPRDDSPAGESSSSTKSEQTHSPKGAETVSAGSPEDESLSGTPSKQTHSPKGAETMSAGSPEDESSSGTTPKQTHSPKGAETMSAGSPEHESSSGTTSKQAHSPKGVETKSADSPKDESSPKSKQTHSVTFAQPPKDTEKTQDDDGQSRNSDPTTLLASRI